MIDTKKLREAAKHLSEEGPFVIAESDEHSMTDVIVYEIDGPTRREGHRTTTLILADRIEKADAVAVVTVINAVPALLDELDKRRWVPVAERLPEDGKCVPAFNDNGLVLAILTCRQWFDISSGGSPTDDVTHWYDLPEPPEVER